ncbi:MAG: DUF3500 domain-containing protein [Pirellula sp.]
MTKPRSRLALCALGSLGVLSGLGTVGLWVGGASQGLAQDRGEKKSATAGVVQAAKKLEEGLSESQRAALVFAFEDEDQRRRWSNLPTGIVARAGLKMGDLTPEQRDASYQVVRAALSPRGYEKVLQIVESDEVLKKQSGRGGRLNFGADEFYLSFVGKPSETAPWMLQFGGHHLGINVTFAGERSTMAPSFVGAQPAVYQIEGKTRRPLGAEVDKSYALLKTLSEAQRKKAVLGFEVRNLVLGPGRDGQMVEPEGIPGSELSESQQSQLIDLASEWTNMLPDAIAKEKLEEMRKNVAETWFAWSGSTEPGAPAYFRIHGPTVFIEFAPQSMGGDPNNHIHTMYRDPNNDYGKKWWNP